MALFICERTIDPKVSAEERQAGLQRLFPCLQAHNVRWIRTYSMPEAGRSFCVYEAADAETIREAQRSARVSFDRVSLATVAEA